ncbi:putative aliphatic sulfonates transport permease protein SsuC [Ruminiclostridium hungatei]|uniref:Putative aliphatic sulfonates transport permease protein SsuC n=1 Tax=Ruminiclostridium hungatei TaxID=48256 RepID=A0A1V4SGL5_RUMHU|nr:ABC transporter permease subunit [Ruminiclostridium hungatei]OPX43072.1 putative aliphatic sulfonates transport permease protein SsuC [Ruminiclostridium hungatei]
MAWKKTAKIVRLIVPWLVPILVIILWYYETLPGKNTTLLPVPDKVLQRTVTMIEDGSLWEYISISAIRAGKGLLLGGMVGLILAFATGLSKILNLALNTTIQMLRTIPILAIISLMIIWFGIGEEVKVYMVAFGVFFPIYINTYHGIKSIDKGLMEMGRVYGLKPIKIFADIILPGTLPSMLVGFRLSLGTMWLVLIAAEQIATDAGIGYMAMTARELLQMDKIVLAIILYAILGKLSDVAATFLEKILIRWRET